MSKQQSKNNQPALPTRRSVIKSSVALLAAGLLPAVFAERATAQATSAGPRARAAAPLVPGTQLVLLGTQGGPGVSLTRSQTASAVVVDGVPYLVDCGYGTVRQLVASNVGYQRIDNVFLTHLHDDHTADLAALLNFQWAGTKTAPTDIYGPYGTARLVESAVVFATANAEIRTVDEGRTLRVDTLYHGHDVNISAQKVAIFKDERVSVTGIQNAHFPERSTAKMPHRSMAIRFDTKTRSIVFSGDTAYSASLVELAKGADMFVCEIMDETVYEQREAQAKIDAAAGHSESVARHVAETHSPPAMVARMASEAKVGTVVLYHQLLGPAKNGLPFAVTAFIEAIHKAGFSGDVIVGQDLMVL